MEELDAYIRNIPDFPEPGIQFKDITPLQKIISSKMGQKKIDDVKTGQKKIDDVKKD